VRPRPALFRALGNREPPARIEINGATYFRARVLKHDSWAATAVYRGPAGRTVCKFNRQQPIFFLPMRWLGRLLARREASFFRQLADVANVPSLTGDVCLDGRPLAHAVAHDYIPGHPLGLKEPANGRFFTALEGLFLEMHRRDMAYVDAHKRENILVGDDGRPYLIDFQISFQLPRWWPANCWAMRVLLRMLQQSDLYHFEKHWARCRPDLCGREICDVVRRRPWWISVHRLVAVPLRTFRRNILVAIGIRTADGQAASEHFPEDVHAIAIEAEGTPVPPHPVSEARKAA
jgi:hypothetical protein